MSEAIDSIAPKRTRRTSNRLGLQELDEDGWTFLSYSAYTCQGSVSSNETQESDEDKK